VRILFVNKFLYAKGGAETHMLALARVLQSLGHELHFFGVRTERVETPPEQTTLVEAGDYRNPGGPLRRAAIVLEVLFGPAAERGLGRALRRFRPHLVHLHNVYHQISPFALRAVRAAGVPAILTAHDSKLVCPAYSLYDGRSFCFNCRKHAFWNILLKRCSGKGRSGDWLLTAEAYLHHLLRLYERHIDWIVSPSRFLADRLLEGGWPRQRLSVLHNALDLRVYRPQFHPGEYMLLAGRLCHGKGVAILIEAARLVPDVPVVIAGDGPLRGQLQAATSSLPNLRWVGYQPQEALLATLAGARALILPSLWPENCPVSVLEAYALGKPVIASVTGGTPELVNDGQTGLLIPPGSVYELAEAMATLWADPNRAERMGRRARAEAERRFDLRDYVDAITQLYRRLARPGDVRIGAAERHGYRAARKPQASLEPPDRKAAQPPQHDEPAKPDVPASMWNYR
jgi:glycosyltransferase involved in cell wall biosynthesis